MAPPDGKKTWLVTGASSGLGLSIALSALEAGHFVLGTARSPANAASSHPEFEQRGGKWLKLDVDNDDATEIVRKAVETELGGKIDVLVNNSGFAKLGTIEDISIDQIRQQMETNFFGHIRVTKGVMAYMRNQKSGTIANMSSVSGLQISPGNTFYGCSKFALEGFTEGLQQELSPFGVRVVLIEPGAFRTPIFASALHPALAESDPYKETLGPMMDFMRFLGENPAALPGDAAKLGDRVIEYIDAAGMSQGLDKCFRLLLGKDAIFTIKGKIKALQTDLDATRHIAESTDHDNLGPEADMYMSYFPADD